VYAVDVVRRARPILLVAIEQSTTPVTQGVLAVLNGFHASQTAHYQAGPRPGAPHIYRIAMNVDPLTTDTLCLALPTVVNIGSRESSPRISQHEDW
jgi:hypothetical protein